MFQNKMREKVIQLSDLDGRALDDGRIQLLADYKIYICLPDFKHIIDIPKGFTSDLSSFPTLFSWIVDWRRVAIAGLVHDYLYSLEGSKQYPLLTRIQKDKVWRAIATHRGSTGFAANWAQGWISYLGIRLGGAKWDAGSNGALEKIKKTFNGDSVNE